MKAGRPVGRGRLHPAVFDLPVDAISSGVYSDRYFVNTREVLKADEHSPNVLMQLFCHSEGWLCGIDEAIAIVELASEDRDALTVRALHDGDAIAALETVMTIEGPYDAFAHLETLCLGAMARGTRIATQTKRVVEAAAPKEVLFFPARHDHWQLQTRDGYAAHVAGANSVSTDMQAKWWGGRGIGTLPHAAIAAYGGNTTLAARKFAEHLAPDIPIVALVDFDNDSVGTALAVARALGPRLYGVRLDTSGSMVDKSVIPQMGQFDPRGVNAPLVHNVRSALDEAGFSEVRIIASGGFTEERVRRFERERVPVDAYGIGSSLVANHGDFDFTADIVRTDGRPSAKVGRVERTNSRLELVR